MFKHFVQSHQFWPFTQHILHADHTHEWSTRLFSAITFIVNAKYAQPTYWLRHSLERHSTTFHIGYVTYFHAQSATLFTTNKLPTTFTPRIAMNTSHDAHSGLASFTRFIVLLPGRASPTRWVHRKPTTNISYTHKSTDQMGECHARRTHHAANHAWKFNPNIYSHV